MVLRSAIRRVRGVFASRSACSQARAMSMLTFQYAGASASSPPIRPVTSSLGASKRWA